LLGTAIDAAVLCAVTIYLCFLSNSLLSSGILLLLGVDLLRNYSPVINYLANVYFIHPLLY
jgi:hypothetical protein